MWSSQESSAGGSSARPDPLIGRMHQAGRAGVCGDLPQPDVAVPMPQKRQAASDGDRAHPLARDPECGSWPGRPQTSAAL